MTALVRIGAASDDLIASELKLDPTEEGRRSAATARASRPAGDAKEEAWSAVKNGDEVSLSMKRAFAAGFHRADQEELLEPFVQRYFDELLDVWDRHSIDEGLMFVRSMYPATIVTQELVDLVNGMLKRDLPGIEGVANAPMMASVEIVVFTSSESNQRSRIGLAAPVRISVACLASAPSLRKLHASLASRMRLPGASDCTDAYSGPGPVS